MITGGGGRGGKRRVQVFDVTGPKQRLPDLIEERRVHGCGHYFNNRQQLVSYRSAKMSPHAHMSTVKVYLVTRGLNDRTRPLASTELLTEGDKRWVSSTPLPSGRLGLTGATLDNKIIIAGRVDKL